MDNEKCVKEIEEWALSLTKCGHGLCSTSEAIYEERFGRECLKIIEKHRKEG